LPVYGMLANLIHAAFDRLDAIEHRDMNAQEIIESLGGKLISLWYTLGPYDFIVVFELPSQERLVNFLTIVGTSGTFRTEARETIPREMLYKIAKDT